MSPHIFFTQKIYLENTFQIFSPETLHPETLIAQTFHPETLHPETLLAQTFLPIYLNLENPQHPESLLTHIMVQHRNLNFSIVFPFHHMWHHFGCISEPQFYREVFHCFLHFFMLVPRFFHGIAIANGFTSKPHFCLFFHSFTRQPFSNHSSFPSVFSEFFLQFY